MNEDDLALLVEQIRSGRQEDERHEWKRQWWDLKKPGGKDEFRKDIAAFANSTKDHPGYIVVGVKGRRLFEAPIPVDEAQLQEILRGITPVPEVSFESHVLPDEGEGKEVSLIVVGPSSNPPYVCEEKGRNVVFLRRGSRVDTATRFDLDQFYTRQTRFPKLSARWHFWDRFSDDAEEGLQGDVLPVPAPRIRLDEVASVLYERLESYKEHHKENGYPELQSIEHFKAGIKPFVESLKKRENWLFWHLRRANRIRVSVVLSNIGSSPAKYPKVRVYFPDWIHIGDRPEKPKDFVQPPPLLSLEAPRPRNRALKEKIEKRRKSEKKMLDEMKAIAAASYAYKIPDLTKPQKGSRRSVSGNSVEFWANRLLQSHSKEIRHSLDVTALPVAPLVTEEIPVRVEFFSEEQDGWEAGQMRIRLVEDDSPLPVLI